MRRSYDNTLRAQQAADTSTRILDAAERLFSTEPFDRVSLAAVAEAADVAIPTLQRKYGNKEGLFQAVGDVVRSRVQSQRSAPPRGDVASAVRQLVAHYEVEGKLMWHLLRQEEDVPFLKVALDEARKMHRAWVEAAFGAQGKERTDALVAATDLYLWKLLRLDLGRSRAAVEKTLIAMVQAVAGEG
jgi:AcrR family transcriptional regulator